MTDETPDTIVGIRRLLTSQEVCQLLGTSREYMYRLISEQQFPPPLRLRDAKTETRVARWRPDDVERWINEREYRPRRVRKQP